MASMGNHCRADIPAVAAKAEIWLDRRTGILPG